MFSSKVRQSWFVGCIQSALLIDNLALKQFSWMNKHTAKLYCASSQLSFSRSAFQQLQMAFSYIDMLKQASPRFLNRQSFSRCLKQFYRIPIDSEYLPKILRAAALLLLRIKDRSQAFPRLASLYSILLHSFRQSLGWLSSRQRKLRYQAAERLFSEYLIADYKYVIAQAALKVSDFSNRASECYSFQVIQTLSDCGVSTKVPFYLVCLLRIRGEASSKFSLGIWLGVGIIISFYSTRDGSLCSSFLTYSSGNWVNAKFTASLMPIYSSPISFFDDSSLQSFMLFESIVFRIEGGASKAGLFFQKTRSAAYQLPFLPIQVLVLSIRVQKPQILSKGGKRPLSSSILLLSSNRPLVSQILFWLFQNPFSKALVDLSLKLLSFSDPCLRLSSFCLIISICPSLRLYSFCFIISISSFFFQLISAYFMLNFSFKLLIWSLFFQFQAITVSSYYFSVVVLVRISSLPVFFLSELSS